MIPSCIHFPDSIHQDFPGFRAGGYACKIQRMNEEKMTAELSTSGTRSLRRFFEDLVWRHFFSDVHLEEPGVAHYVSNLLTDFGDARNLFKIQNSAGDSLEDVGEMLVESDPQLEAASFDRERAVRKHVGDYTLFITGLFPESVGKSSRKGRPRLDEMVDFVKAGKESYAIVSSFDQFEYREEASLFRRLSENFELCVFGLNLVKQDIESFQFDYYQRLQHSAFGESPL